MNVIWKQRAMHLTGMEMTYINQVLGVISLQYRTYHQYSRCICVFTIQKVKTKRKQNKRGNVALFCKTNHKPFCLLLNIAPKQYDIK